MWILWLMYFCVNDIFQINKLAPCDYQRTTDMYTFVTCYKPFNSAIGRRPPLSRRQFFSATPGFVLTSAKSVGQSLILGAVTFASVYRQFGMIGLSLLNLRNRSIYYFKHRLKTELYFRYD